MASTSASLSRPLPRRFLKVAVRRSDRELNTRRALLSSGFTNAGAARPAAWPRTGRGNLRYSG
ncbi:hypothetical protein ART_1176 [Arthrobacter sp. PAMC 25486]|nr:hypothetical protein ART_1176 [Arthrobacter sp. PAMC 25486]